MGTISIIVGIILFVILTGIRVWLVLKRCNNFKDRLLGLIKFPGSSAKRAEVLVAISQLTAACWFGIGLILQSDGFQSSIKTAQSSRPIEIGLLIAPMIVFLILLGGITRKSE